MSRTEVQQLLHDSTEMSLAARRLQRAHAVDTTGYRSFALDKEGHLEPSRSRFRYSLPSQPRRVRSVPECLLHSTARLISRNSPDARQSRESLLSVRDEDTRGQRAAALAADFLAATVVTVRPREG